jgi:dTDP-4-dehydrorhamnose 3,5-epimerase
MRFAETEIRGVFVVDLERHEDERGYFARMWCAEEFTEHGLSGSLAQANMAFSAKAGTMRGMHYQLPPHEEAKLVRCMTGAFWDVALDLRAGSPTYLRHVAVELTAENKRALYVPEGCAHGYQTLVDDTEAFYLHSVAYAPGSEAGARWDDPAFAIPWPEAAIRILSAKDAVWPDYQPDARVTRAGADEHT